MRVLAAELIDRAETLYRGGMTLREVGAALGRDKDSLHRHLLRRGAIRHQVRAECRSDFWDPMTPESSWVLGVLLTDGAVQSDMASLEMVDKDVVEKVKTLTGSQCALRTRVREIGKRLWSVTLAGAGFMEGLHRFAAPGRKFDRLVVPEILDGLWPHFVRGLWDGDGSVAVCQKKVPCNGNRIVALKCNLISCTVPFLESIGVKLHELAGLVLHKVYICGKYPYLSYSNLDSVKLCKWLYAGQTENMRCERKYQNWMRFVASLDRRSFLRSRYGLVNNAHE